MKTAFAKKTIMMLLCLIISLGCIFSVGTISAEAAPSQKPPQVKNLKATAGTTYIKLSWKKASDSADYAVFFFNPSNKKYTVIANVSKTNYTVKNLDPDTDYHFAVQAYNTSNGKRNYGEVSASLKASTKSAKPGQVKDLKATVLGIKQIKLKWDKIADASYAVYSYNPTTKKYTLLDTVSSPSYTVKNLKPDTLYRFAVRAYKTVNSERYYGKYSEIVKATTAPSIPTLKTTKALYTKALGVYMDWVYFCNYAKFDETISLDFYGLDCQFAKVEHKEVKSKKDLEKLLREYFTQEIYRNELYLYREVDNILYGNLYYYAEGGKSECDKGVMYYKDKLTKVNGVKYLYTLTPVYYDGFDSEFSPKKYTFTLVVENGKWIFTDNFYPCCATIK